MDTVKYLLKNLNGYELRDVRLYIGREKRLEEALKSGRFKPTALVRGGTSIWHVYEILEERQRMIKELRQ